MTRILAIVLTALMLGAAGYAVKWYVYDREVPEAQLDVPPEDLKALVDGNNQFAIDLYKKLAEKEQGNIVVSPYSISSALAMTYAGARGQTAEEMAKVLHFNLPQDRLHPAFGGTTRWLTTKVKRSRYELNIANALWAQKGLGFAPEFLDVTGASYEAGLREVDFANPEAARGAINRWVEEKTENRIKELLEPQDINPDVRLVLTNAIYFKGEWEQPFDPANTHDGDFKTGSGQMVRVPMMHLSRAKVRLSWGSDLSLLSLPYSGNRYEMVFLVPAVQRNLRDIERSLTAAEIRKRLDGLSENMQDVAIPRFKFGSRVVLSSALSQLGMPTAFSDHADFSGITRGERLKIKDVIHGGNIEVDEVGTTAAAATAVVMVVKSYRGEFRIDRACLFVIRDSRTGSMLFLGRLDNPR